MWCASLAFGLQVRPLYLVFLLRAGGGSIDVRGGPDLI